MKKLVISVTLMVCLILPGSSGSVFGQSDSLKQNLNSIQDINKWKKNLDSIQVIYKWKQNQYLIYELNNYQHNTPNYPNQTRQRRPNNFGLGTGIYYQWGFYGGDTSNYISTQRVFYFPIINFDFYVKKFVFQALLIGYGRTTVNGININGDNFKGTFCGESFGLNMAMGYEACSNSYISIIPNIGFQVHEYSVYAGADPGIFRHSNSLTEFTITSYSFGLMADYKILKMNVHDINEISYISIRLKYDYCLPTREDEYFSGNAHQFTFGLTATIRGKKSK